MDEYEAKRHKKLYKKMFPRGLIRSWEASTAKMLGRMDDDELAAWHEDQLKKDEDGAKCILASQEWHRRLMAEQLTKALRNSIVAGAITSIFSFLLGILSQHFTSLLSCLK